MTDNQEITHDTLLNILRDAVKKDQVLREQYQIGSKFRFVRDRLAALLQQVEASAAVELQEIQKQQKTLGAEEKLVYVYLFNAQGLNIASWQKMVAPGVFYEHSVNRPVYADKKAIEALLRTKATQNQHGYLTIAVHDRDILPSTGLTDALGSPLTKVREGALKVERLISLTTNGAEYVLNAKDELVRKD